jgi:hypothetical protein
MNLEIKPRELGTGHKTDFSQSLQKEKKWGKGKKRKRKKRRDASLNWPLVAGDWWLGGQREEASVM